MRTELTVCASCQGSGISMAHIECDGGGFTSSEWAEACADDPDFAESYFSDVHERPCPDCNGRNVVPIVSDDNDPELLAALLKAIKDEQAFQQERYYERMVGA